MKYSDELPEEQLMKCVGRMKEAFEVAAARSEGPARPLFEKMRDAFNRAVEQVRASLESGADLDKMGKVMQEINMEMQETGLQIRKIALQDPETAIVFGGLGKTLMKEMMEILRIQQGMMDEEMGMDPPPAAPSPPSPPRPKRPGTGKIKFD